MGGGGAGCRARAGQPPRAKGPRRRVDSVCPPGPPYFPPDPPYFPPDPPYFPPDPPYFPPDPPYFPPDPPLGATREGAGSRSKRPAGGGTAERETRSFG